MKTFEVTIQGTTPLLQHRFGESAEADVKKTTRRISIQDSKTPREHAEAVSYVLPNGNFWIPGAAFAKLMTEAAGGHKIRGSRKSAKFIVPAAVLVLDPNGGHFSNSIGPLGTRGYINQTPSGVELTTAGQKAVGAMEPVRLQTYHEAVWGVARNKNGRAGDILNHLICRGNKPCSCSDIGRALDIDPDGGHFSNSIGPLSTLGLITRRNGVVTPTALLFPEGLT